MNYSCLSEIFKSLIRKAKSKKQLQIADQRPAMEYFQTPEFCKLPRARSA